MSTLGIGAAALFASMLSTAQAVPADAHDQTLNAGSAAIVLIKHGYHRRDLGLDPQHNQADAPYWEEGPQGSRGFRSNSAVEHSPGGAPAAVDVYCDSYYTDQCVAVTRGGLRFYPGDPALRQNSGR